MPYYLNPFAKHDISEFPDVHIPLQRAVRHQSVVSKAEKDGDTDTSSEGGLTIESLRAEVEADLAAGGLNTAYDGRFCTS